MDLNWSPKDFAFRDEVRAFLDAELTPDLREAVSRMTSVYAPPDISAAWQRKLHARGWAAPAWPVEYGGCDWTLAQRAIFARELASAGAPPISPMGIGMCGPALIRYGTEAQKAHYLPRMLRGEDFWCQGYSEPQSGSDLASLQMKAVSDGDDFICTGQKIWTTHAQHANMVFCLVRTTQSAKPQFGITFLLIDMKAPGVRVRPIVSLAGEHIQNEIFFDAVRVPKANAVGRIDEGWTVAKALLEFERGGGAYAPGLLARLSRIERIAREEGCDEGFFVKLAEARMDIEALDAFELRHLARMQSGETPGQGASVVKIRGTELSQRLTELALEAAAHYPAAWQPHLLTLGGPALAYDGPQTNTFIGPAHAATMASKYFNDRAGSIYGGSNEIQRNILARAALSL